MIILNGLNGFIFRFSYAFVQFYGFIYKYDRSEQIFKPNQAAYIICYYFVKFILKFEKEF